MLHHLTQKFLFSLTPEQAHHFTLKTLKLTYHLGLLKQPNLIHAATAPIMGLAFPNRIGLAAGLDKNGEYIDALACLGFGFIEIGTVTPKPQSGHPKPRLFRLIEEEALINRMGFNNKGVDYVITQLKKTRYRGILGINIGKNHNTPLATAHQDYVGAFKRLAPYASYITINISSPNTENLRQLQQADLLQPLLRAVKSVQSAQVKYVPLVVKISPDLSLTKLETLAEILLAEKIDGVIAGNTTIQRKNITEDAPYFNEAGGLSGAPLAEQATQLIQMLAPLLQNKIPIIGCGGIYNVKQAQKKLAAGAHLLQLYTGLVYRGSALIRTLTQL